MRHVETAAAVDEVRGISDLAFGNNATCALKK